MFETSSLITVARMEFSRESAQSTKFYAAAYIDAGPGETRIHHDNARAVFTAADAKVGDYLNKRFPENYARSMDSAPLIPSLRGWSIDRTWAGNTDTRISITGDSVVVAGILGQESIFSRDIEYAIIDLAAVVSSMGMHFENKAPEVNIHVSMDVVGGLPLPVMGEDGEAPRRLNTFQDVKACTTGLPLDQKKVSLLVRDCVSQVGLLPARVHQVGS